MQTSPNILIFDSGVGGLTIAVEIEKKIPNCKLVYTLDNAAFPYGTKTEQELRLRVIKVISKILVKYPIDIIVIACNSACTAVLPIVRESFQQPVVGVIPAIKPAAAISKSKILGLLATPGTIARPYTKHLIKAYAPSCKIITAGTMELVYLAERKLQGYKIESDELRRATTDLFSNPQAKGMDTVVLACTHFPVLKSELKKIVSEETTWVDSAAAVAERTLFWIRRLKPACNIETKAINTHECVFTASNQSVARTFSSIQDRLKIRADIIEIPN